MEAVFFCGKMEILWKEILILMTEYGNIMEIQRK